MLARLLARLDQVENWVRMALSRAGGVAAETQYAFVFRPGAVAPLAPNVYNDWHLLYAATQRVQGPKLVEIDVSLAPAVVPAGTYNISDWTLSGIPNNTVTGQPLLTFAAGAFIDPATTQWSVILGLGITSGANATIWFPTSPGGLAPAVFLHDVVFLQSGGATPLIHINAGVTLIIDADGGGVGDDINPAIQVDAGGTLAANAADGGGFARHAVAGTGTFNLAIVPGGFFEQPQGLEPVITYIDPPQIIGETNAAPITAGPVVFTSTGTITRRSSGLVQGSACATVTGAGAGAPVIFTVLRNPGGVVIGTQTVDGGATHTHCTIPVFDTLPDQSPHTYAIEAAQAATALTIAAGGAIIAISELT